MITGYKKLDIIELLQRIYRETEENRTKALKMYDIMEAKMMVNTGDLIILSQMADRYLEQATRQTELLVRLTATMQRLNEANDAPEENMKALTDLNSILDKFEIGKLTPFDHEKRLTKKSSNLLENVNVEIEQDVKIDMQIPANVKSKDE